MAYGIDPSLPKELQDWNSPEHWLRSDMQSALARNDIDKARVFADVLKTTIGAGAAADTNKLLSETEIEKTKLGIEPNLLKAKKETAPSPTGQAIIDRQAALSGAAAPPVLDYVSRLSRGWSLPGKDLLFK